MSQQALVGKHALVTGGGSGIGAACAAALLARGARVTIVGRDAARLAAACAELSEQRNASAAAIASEINDVSDSATIAFEVIDVTDNAAVQAGFARAAARFGRVDILVNSAGQAAAAPFAGTDDALWQRMLAVNLTGPFHCTQAALPGMLEAGWGRVVNIASTAALRGYRYVSAYTAAKHGLLGLTRALALEVATRGVTVNAVCPGYTETAMFAETLANIVARTGRSEAAARAALVAGNPQGRLIQSAEVASTVTWLCLPDSGAINGQSIAVAGGEVM